MARLPATSGFVPTCLCRALFLSVLLFLGFEAQLGGANKPLLLFTRPQTLPPRLREALHWTVQTRSDGSSMVSLCGRHGRRLKEIGNHGGRVIHITDETIIKYESKPEGSLTVQVGGYSMVMWIRGREYMCTAPGATLSGGAARAGDLLAIVRSPDYSFKSCLQAIFDASIQLERPCAYALRDRVGPLVATACPGTVVSLVGLREAEPECHLSAEMLSPVRVEEEAMSL